MTDIQTIKTEDHVLGPLLNLALQSKGWKKIHGLLLERDYWETEVLKYRPERRLCLRIKIPHSPDLKNYSSFIMKVWYNKRGERIHRNLSALNEQTKSLPHLHLPDPIVYEPKAHAMVYREIEGTPLTEWLRPGNDHQWVETVARAVAGLHSLQLPEKRRRTPADEVNSVVEQLSKIDTPELRKAINNKLDNFSQTAPEIENESLLHRDLYDQQILLKPDGSVFMLDLDDMAYGDPMLDIGNILAHVHLIRPWRRHPDKYERMEERFLRHYRKHLIANDEEIFSTLRWYKDISLCRLAALQAVRKNETLSRQLLADIETDQTLSISPQEVKDD